uniref:Cytochrome b n=1 Tax=Heterorhabditis bacteriophora TaxID=37862 RepID=A0A1I7WTA5_HETBA
MLQKINYLLRSSHGFVYYLIYA